MEFSITSIIGLGKVLIRGGSGGELRVVDIYRRGLSSHNSVVNNLDREVRRSKMGF